MPRVIGTGGSKILSFDKNKMTMLNIESVGGKLRGKQTLHFCLENLCYYVNTGTDIDVHTVADFTAKLSWDFEYTDNTRYYEINKPVHLNNINRNTLTTIEISPLSIWFKLEGDDVTMITRPVIHFKNGKSIQLEVCNDFNTTYAFTSFLDGKEGGVLTIGRHFDEIIDLSDIANIVIGDVTVPIE